MSTKLAHIADPAVSHDAAINLTPAGREIVMHVIVDLIADHGPLTPKELERYYHQNRFVAGWPEIALQSVAKRASEAKKHIRVLHGTGIRRDGAEALDLTVDPMTAKTRISAYMNGDTE
jgi:hypothetical protein